MPSINPEPAMTIVFAILGNNHTPICPATIQETTYRTNRIAVKPKGYLLDANTSLNCFARSDALIAPNDHHPIM
jgi:hypothetical protein